MIPTFSLLQALNSLFRQTGVLTAAFPTWQSEGQPVYSFYQDLAPEGAPLPYLVFNVLPAPAQAVYGKTALFTEPSIRFTAYTTDSDSAMVAMNTLCGVLDDNQLSLPNGNTQLFTQRMGDPTPRLDSRNTGATASDAKEVWAATVVYNFAAQ